MTPEELLRQVQDAQATPIERLTRLMAILRSPEGCAWDRKQDHKSLLPYLLEETHEVIEAITAEDDKELKGELGDLLCQIVFHAQLASERGAFTLDQVIDQLVTKLIERHPHVFGKRKELEAQQVRDQWERQKSARDTDRSILAGVPKSLPALTMAFRIGEKAGGVGFDWPNAQEVLGKVDEELTELREAMLKEPQAVVRQAEELGDLLFAVASLGRKLGIDPEQALKLALMKFRERFEKLETEVRELPGGFSGVDLAALEAIWQLNKQQKRTE